MSWLPQSNATLLSINGGGASEDYDFPEGVEPAKWSGSVEAYVREKVVQSMQGGVLNKAKDTRLIIPADLEPPVDIRVGDTATYEYAGQTFTRIILEFDEAILADVPHNTIRLHLQASQG